MIEHEQTTTRDINGRFLPGRSGNPAGKKPGTRNRATALRAALADGEDVAAARVVIDRALGGDAVAARFVVGRLTPCPRGREIALDLPDGTSATDILAASNATVAAMAAGEITPDEALTVTRVLDGRLRALKAAARENKLSQPARQEPSPVYGRGGSSFKARGIAGDFRSRLLHSTCILQPYAFEAGTRPGTAPPSLTDALAAA